MSELSNLINTVEFDDSQIKLNKQYQKLDTICDKIYELTELVDSLEDIDLTCSNAEVKMITKKRKVISITDLAPPPSIGEEKQIEEVNAPPPLKSTIKFTPPVVKPDDQVTEEYIPTVDELKDVDPGARTEEGVEGGVDYSLIEVEEKVVEEKKEEAPVYFVAVEEMPEPIGGIAAIQQLITYPEIAKRAGVEGKVYVLAFVDEKGNVTNAKIIKGIGAGCDEAAIDAVLQTRFKPGKQRGTPVKVQVSIPIVFKLQ